MPFKFTALGIRGLVLVEPRVFEDERGFFVETYKRSEFSSNGIEIGFIQDNHSRSARNVLRGLHFQRSPKAQAKLVRVMAGAVWDVAVDLRPDSPSYGEWEGIELSSENMKMLYIPEGFAHGFVSLRDDTHLVYKCSAEYDQSCEGGIRWDDPDLGITWPVRDVVVSDKDAVLPSFKDLP